MGLVATKVSAKNIQIAKGLVEKHKSPGKYTTTQVECDFFKATGINRRYQFIEKLTKNVGV